MTVSLTWPEYRPDERSMRLIFRGTSVVLTPVSTTSMTWPEYLAGCCRIDGRLTRLSFREADLILTLLLSHPDHWAHISSIIECIWPNADEQPVDADGVVKITVMRLRRRGISIENRYQFGYRIPREARGREAMRLAA